MLPEMCLVQCRLDLFNVTCEDVCYESLSVHDFTRCRYCMPDTCEMHGLVQGNDGLYHVNADLWGVARHNESNQIRLSKADWRVTMGPSESGATRRARRNGRGEERSRSLRVCEERALLPSRQTYSRLHKNTLLWHREGADAHPSETIQTRVITRVSLTPASNHIELNSLVQIDAFYSTVVKHSRKRSDSYRGRCTAIPGLRGRLTVASSVFIKQMSSLWPEEWGKSYVSRETSFIPQSCVTLSACTSSSASI